MINLNTIPRISLAPEFRDQVARLSYFDGEPLTFILEDVTGPIRLALAASKQGGSNPEARQELPPNRALKAALGLAADEEIYDIPYAITNFIRDGRTLYGNVRMFDPQDLQRDSMVVRAIEALNKPAIVTSIIPDLLDPFAIVRVTDIASFTADLVQEIEITPYGGRAPYEIVSTNFGTFDGLSIFVDFSEPQDRTVTVIAKDAEGVLESVSFRLTLTEAPSVTLSALTLSGATSIPENTASGTVIGTLSGAPVGAMLTMLDSAGSRFALVGKNVVVGTGNLAVSGPTAYTFTVRQTHPDVADPFDTEFTRTITPVDDWVISATAIVDWPIPETPSAATGYAIFQ